MNLNQKSMNLPMTINHFETWKSLRVVLYKPERLLIHSDLLDGIYRTIEPKSYGEILLS